MSYSHAEEEGVLVPVQIGSDGNQVRSRLGSHPGFDIMVMVVGKGSQVNINNSEPHLKVDCFVSPVLRGWTKI